MCVGVIMYVCESYGCVRVFLVECNFEVVNLLHGGDDNDDDDVYHANWMKAR